MFSVGTFWYRLCDRLFEVWVLLYIAYVGAISLDQGQKVVEPELAVPHWIWVMFMALMVGGSLVGVTGLLIRRHATAYTLESVGLSLTLIGLWLYVYDRVMSLIQTFHSPVLPLYILILNVVVVVSLSGVVSIRRLRVMRMLKAARNFDSDTA